ncbi:hypothetical protein J6TS1_51370 [Siminovitchia terrae]|uniref:Uncharacterized protein n=1 Tax=Siminovitchia terrae TaxID=1914933 RepID=A0ABQ4L5G8_SIMTE|nr:hypothetical protein J6TS1_51370 [Siminovitchia terrae]
MTIIFEKCVLERNQRFNALSQWGSDPCCLCRIVYWTEKTPHSDKLPPTDDSNYGETFFKNEWLRLANGKQII